VNKSNFSYLIWLDDSEENYSSNYQVLVVSPAISNGSKNSCVVDAGRTVYILLHTKQYILWQNHTPFAHYGCKRARIRTEPQNTFCIVGMTGVHGSVAAVVTASLSISTGPCPLSVNDACTHSGSWLREF